MKKRNKHEDPELLALVERRQKTKEIRAAVAKLPPGGKGVFTCPYCGAVADIEKPFDTYKKIACRQCGYTEDAWGF